MLFNSFEFLIFLPLVFALYWFVFNKSLRWQNGLLLVASYFFYGWWSYKFLGLLALSTILDYFYGFSVASPNRKKAKLFLWLSIINNVGILAVFKYYDFFITQFQAGLELLGLKANLPLLQVALPIGISFYTFHGMSYVFDIYRGKQKPVSNIVDYAVFVAFFPLLVIGPIERAHHLIPQIQKSRSFSYTQAVEGCRLILWGMCKKILIADSLGVTVDKMFANQENFNGISLIVGAIAFAFQVYGDFSGYSDIALGTSKLLGFEIFSNFRFPYFSRDIAEFWRRWHISLMSWFRDYLYIPLGGSRQGKAKTIRNIFIIFLVSGLWHGAAWNYIVFGLLHACAFLPLILLNRNRRYLTDVVAENKTFPSGKELLQMITTFAFVTFALVVFRSHSIDSAFDYYKHIIVSLYENPGQVTCISGASTFLYIIPLVICDWWLRHDERKLRTIKNRLLRRIVYSILVLAVIVVIIISRDKSFIYFQF